MQKKILKWYDSCGRHSLPWKVKDIYKIWISEIMLQQTQVKTVLPYFKKFINKYPNLKALSKAKLNDILKLWSGVGYYSRAENIFKTVQIIKLKHKMIFPTRYDEVINLPGIGKTTASAILTFAEKGNFPILDGNIKRLLSRIYGIKSNIYSRNIERELWKLSENLLPAKRASDFIQGLMDIGSMVCKKNKPICEICPLQKNCQAFEENLFDLPKIKKKSRSRKEELWAALIVNSKKKIYMQKISKNNLWKGLYSSPIFPNKEEMFLWLKEKNVGKKHHTKSWNFVHKLSHIDFLFNVNLFELKSNKKLSLIDDNWYNLSNIDYGTPKFQEKILSYLSINYV